MLAHALTTMLHHSPTKNPCLYNSLEFIYKKSHVGEVTHMAICNWGHSHPEFPSIQPQVPIKFVLKITQSLVLCLTKWIIGKDINFYAAIISTHIWALNHSHTLYIATYIHAYVYQYIFIDLCSHAHMHLWVCLSMYFCVEICCRISHTHMPMLRCTLLHFLPMNCNPLWTWDMFFTFF